MNICVIPARGNSKRIPKKNIREFFGKPLIAYSIEAALKAGIFTRVVVSTDDMEIAEIAKSCGAEIPFMRPNQISTDYTDLAEVVDHAYNYFVSEGEVYEYICTIYATAPFIQVEYLLKGYEVLKNSNAINSFSCALMPFPIQRSFKINQNGRCKMFTPEHYSTRSQDLEESYQDAGQFYWTNKKRQNQNNNKILFSETSIPIIIPRYFVQDIDTPEDWQQAELMFEAYRNNQLIKQK